MFKIDLTEDQMESWINKYFDCRTRKCGDEILICNPFDNDTGYHFNISLAKQCCHDWRGDSWAGYNPRTGKKNKCTFLRFVRLYLERKRGGCTFVDALQDVLGSSSSACSYLRARRSHDRKKAKEEASLGLPVGALSICESENTRMKQSIMSWMHERAIDDRKIEKYKIMSSGFDIIWPYYEYDELVYWQSRSRIEKRFEFPPESVGVTKGQFLYGFDHVDPASYLILVEAIFCCMTLEDQALASGGALLTPEQVKKIVLLGPSDGVILAADNDVPGVESILSNASAIGRNVQRIFYAIPPQIEFTNEYGEKSYTKDWNDIARYTTEDARQIFEGRVKRLGIRQKLELRSILDQMRRR